MERRTIRVTGKRQITIPQKFFEALGFGKEVECVLQNNAIVIRPIRSNEGGEFAEQILADLISQGLSGEELLQKFRETQKKIRPAVERMLKDAEDAAHGKGEFYTLEDVFGEEEKE